MRAHEIILEEPLMEYSFSKPLIVVDVQPQYITSIHFEKELAQYINKRTSNKTLMFFNGTEVTEDDADDIKYWWYENGMQEDTIEELTWVEKEHGYFRSWMDNGISDDVMIKVIREMYLQKVSDTRDLFDGDVEKLSEFVGDEWEEWMKGDPMSINWTNVGLLKQYNGCYICGGGEHECLREITLLMNAFNIKYTLLQQFIF